MALYLTKTELISSNFGDKLDDYALKVKAIVTYILQSNPALGCLYSPTAAMLILDKFRRFTQESGKKVTSQIGTFIDNSYLQP